jgi:hypothetical protein
MSDVLKLAVLVISVAVALEILVIVAEKNNRRR